MERITVKVIVDEGELAPIDMGVGEEDPVYKDDIVFFSTGHVYNKERSRAPYDYVIRLNRHKTEEEKRA